MRKISVDELVEMSRPFLKRYSSAENSENALRLSEILQEDSVIERIPHWYELLALRREFWEERELPREERKYKRVTLESNRNYNLQHVLTQDALGIVNGHVVFGSFRPKRNPPQREAWLEIDGVNKSVDLPKRYIGEVGYITGGIEIDGVIIPKIDIEEYIEVQKRETHWDGYSNVYYPRFFGQAQFYIRDEKFTGRDVFFQLVCNLDPTFELDGLVPKVYSVHGDWKTTLWLTKK